MPDRLSPALEELLRVDQENYDALRLKWRKGLPEVLVRSLAVDYLRGIVDESTTDAFEEYQARWGSNTRLRGQRKKSKKQSKKTPHHR